MGYGGYRGAGHAPYVHRLTPEQRITVLRLQEDHLHQLQETRNRSSLALENNRHLAQADYEASQALVDAQTRATEEELAALIKRSQETRAAREKAREDYEKARVELEAMERNHSRRMVDMVEEYHMEREAQERQARHLARLDEPGRSAPIPMPQLRVVNREPSSSISP